MLHEDKTIENLLELDGEKLVVDEHFSRRFLE